MALDDLLDWQADETAVAQAEARSGGGGSEFRQTHRARILWLTNSVTAAREWRLEQAERDPWIGLNDEYVTAFDPGKGMGDYISMIPHASPGEQHPNCTGETVQRSY